MDEQNPYPHDSGDQPQDGTPHETPPEAPADPYATPPGAPYDASDDTSPNVTGAYAEHTRPLPPYTPAGQPQGPNQAPNQGPPQGPFGFDASPWQSSYPPAQPTRTKGRGLTAAVLVGALVLGGAAGVGGSALYTAFHDDNGTSSTGSTGNFQATKTATLQDGTVEKVANAVLPSVVKVNVTGSSGAGSGSGIVLSKDGDILTNNHVVSAVGGNGSISVNFNDGTTKKATVVGTDPLTDVAVIKVAGVDNLTPASLGKSGALRVGQTVVAVGSPYGLNATVTSGIVSALNRPVSVSTQEQSAPTNPFGQPQQPQQQPQQGGADLSTTYPAIQTDAAINPGNSGGALVDMSGRVVGINSSIRTASSSSVTGDSGGSIGLGFAIPIDEVLPIVNQITDKQKPTHARLGVSVSDVSGSSLTQGAQLRSVEGGGAGAKAGLKNGDIITKVDDALIDSSESLVATVRGHRPGDQVKITYLRGGKTQTATADLGSDANTQTS